VELVQLIALAVELEEIDQVVARGSVLAAAEPAPCRPRDRLAVAQITLATKISGVVPISAPVAAAEPGAVVRILVLAVAASVVVAVATPLTQVA
jgi:hypothetical protein